MSHLALRLRYGHHDFLLRLSIGPASHCLIWHSGSEKPARALKIAVETRRYEEDGWRVRKDGSFFWASVVIDPIRNDAGELIGFAKITRDITERREAQEKLLTVQRQLAESQKVDALGQLTGGVAHDFNNFLMIISGSLHTIRKAITEEKALRALQSIEGASQRAASLTRQLLTFARRQSVQPQAVKLSERLDALSDRMTFRTTFHIPPQGRDFRF